MRAQLVSENISFERGGDDHIYTKIGIGERERVLKFLDYIANDIQFQKGEPEYMGYLNVGEDLLPDIYPQYKEAYQMFVKNWRKYLPDLEERGLYVIDSPTIDETIFYDEPEPSYGVHAIRESLDFERGQDPKYSMGLGRFRDKNGNLIQVGDTVNVEGVLEEDDFWDFQGTVDSFRGEYITVEDMDGDLFDVEPYKLELVSESLEFERGKDPLSAMGLGKVSRIPLLILKADLTSGYGIGGFPGTIHTIQVIGPRRFQINFSHDRIKNLSTNKSISKPEYAKLLVREIGMDNLITNIVHAHGTGQSWIFTLDPKYANVIPRETYDYDDLGDEDPLKESLEFERGKDPYDALDVGRKALLRKKANEIEWDWYPDPEELESEEVIDIRQYKGFNTKIAKIEDSDSYRINPDGSAERKWAYYAVSDTGEPYFEDPTFYEDPENAWHYERQFLDEYYEENQ